MAQSLAYRVLVSVPGTYDGKGWLSIGAVWADSYDEVLERWRSIDGRYAKQGNAYGREDAALLAVGYGNDALIEVKKSTVYEMGLGFYRIDNKEDK